jgi:hypothetical protein
MSSSNRHGSAVGCNVIAQASVRASPEEITALRRSPGALGAVAFPPSLLRHADEQTVVGLAAVLRAVREGGLDPAGFGTWGVVSAPRFPGRGRFDSAFPEFLEEGAWGVSPHLVPNHSLHSVSGIVSQALGARGPNLGVGGAPGEELEAFLAAAVLLDDRSMAGVWIVLTGWDPGRDDAGRPGDFGACDALALALILAATTEGSPGTRLWLHPGGVQVESPTGAFEGWLASGTRSTCWRVDGGHGSELVPLGNVGPDTGRVAVKRGKA